MGEIPAPDARKKAGARLDWLNFALLSAARDCMSTEIENFRII